MPEGSSAPVEIYLFPGESHFARRPTIIRTLLGSCVGATFWSARLGAGAMCHALLPRSPDKLIAHANVAIGRRFVDFAVRELAQRFQILGAAPGEVQVKLFGGADVLPVAATASPRHTIGEQNCEAAFAALKAE